MSQADPAEIDPLINSRIDGRYTVHGILGAGGMGVVYEGVHDDLGRSVAIKVLNAAWASDRTAVERFLREARTASSFSHGNIVDVTDLGRLPDGRPYLVMPRVVGVDLASLLAEIGPQPAKRVAALLSGVAAALDLVHAKGFVHRDIKPENLMYVVREDGSETVMLLDFGIAAAVMSSGPRLTRQGSIFGTPHYLPPEVCAGERPDARGDVYALAAVAFEMITGELPFPLDDIMQLMATKVTSDPPSLAAVTGQVFPAELERVIAQGMARDPKQRFPTASGFVTALHAATQDAPVSWQSGVLRSTMRSDEHVVSRPFTPGTPSPAPERPQSTRTPRPAEDAWSAHGPTLEAPQLPPSRPPSGGYGRRSNPAGFGSGRTSSPNLSASGSTRLPTGQDVSARLRVMDERMYRTAPVPMRTSWLRYVLVAAAGSVVVLALMQLKAAKRDDVPDVTNTTTAPATSPVQAIGQPVVPPALNEAAPAAQPQRPAPAAAHEPARPAAPAVNEPARAAPAAANDRPLAAPPPSAAVQPSPANDPAPAAAPPAAEPARAPQPPAAALPSSSPALQAPVAVPHAPAASVKQPAAPSVPEYVPEPSALPEPAAPVVVMRAEEEEIPDIPVRDFTTNPEPMPERRPANDPARAAEYTREASSALLRGEVSRAVELSRSATSADAGYSLGWRTLGLALERSGMTSDAVDAYKRYLRLSPSGQQADMVRQRMKSLGQ